MTSLIRQNRINNSDNAVRDLVGSLIKRTYNKDALEKEITCKVYSLSHLVKSIHILYPTLQVTELMQV